jgi:hypothetical protein
MIERLDAGRLWRNGAAQESNLPSRGLHTQTVSSKPSSNTTNDKFVNWLLQNQIAQSMIENGYKAQNRSLYGSNYAPTGAHFISGQVGCAGDEFVQTPFKSYGVC